MREVQVVIRCDKCGGDRAEPQTELNSKGKPVEVDLDKRCRDAFAKLKEQAAQILAPLTDLIDEKGVAPEKATKAAAKNKPQAKRGGERICLLCPETRGSDNGLLAHMHKEHGWPSSMPVIWGNVCPLDGQEYPRVAQHLAQSHKDHANTSQAFHWAKENGDEHGVVAARIAEMEKVAAAAA